jgi:Bacterial PH domain
VPERGAGGQRVPSRRRRSPGAEPVRRLRQNGGVSRPVETVRLRPSPAALPAVLVLALCVLPLATARPWLLVLLAIPLLALLWVLRVAVDVDGAGVTVRAVFGQRRIPWEEVSGLQVGRRGDLWLVRSGGGRLRLPTARARHLPVIAAASGGRVSVPTPDDAASTG